METLFSLLLVIPAVLLAIPVATFCLEIAAAIALSRSDCSAPVLKDARQRVAVLVPAHDESTGLLPTLVDIKAQMHVTDRVVVVADNCSDDTAAVAAAAGAEVVERNEPERRGKGYALAWGLRYLRADPPEIVVVIDADCRLDDGAIGQLAAACTASHRPVQALDLMVSSDESPLTCRVAEFAWRVKNWIRPLGLRTLRLPCQLMGTGMAFPWDLMCSVDLASGLIVEDLKLGLDLALAGSPPAFCPSARVTSRFPSSIGGVRSQRLRWEHGHIGLMLSAVPSLVVAGINRRSLALLALAFDLMVPPLSLLGTLLIVMLGVAGAANWFGASSTAAMISLASFVGFAVSIFLSWLGYGRQILPPGSVLLLLLYVIEKFPIYRQIFSSKSESRWVRTDRRKV